MKILDILKNGLTQESGPQTWQQPRMIHQLKSDRDNMRLSSLRE